MPHSGRARRAARTTLLRGSATVALAALLLSHSLGCAAGNRPFAGFVEEPGQAPDERILIIGESVEKRPLRLHLFGEPPYRTFVFAAIHGDERSAVSLGGALVDHLRTYPRDRQGAGVAVLPVANPDGVLRNTRQNANGVDLNRNFPASNWTRLPRSNRHGPEAASEPETRAVVRAMRELRPERVISIHSIHGGRECNNFDGPAGQLAQLMARFNRYAVTSHIGYPTPGSFGSWAGRDQGVPSITLELPRDIGPEASWRSNGPALLAVISTTSGAEARLAE